MNRGYLNISDHDSSSFDFPGNAGQSMIETIVAIFVLTTGLAGGLSLAIFVFSASSSISEKLTGVGIAREGIEIVRSMRDSNWLAGSIALCPDLGTDQSCHSNWLNNTYDITGSSGTGRSYRAEFNPGSVLSRWSLSSNSDYRLYADASGAFTHNPSGESTLFFRKINIVYADTNPPYSPVSPLVLVRSQVWWHGRNCPSILDLVSPSDTPCKIISEEYLTNWKNY